MNINIGFGPHPHMYLICDIRLICSNAFNRRQENSSTMSHIQAETRQSEVREALMRVAVAACVAILARRIIVLRMI